MAMNVFDNWTEVTRGLYRYAIAPYVAYEIHIRCWKHKDDIQKAKCDFYIFSVNGEIKTDRIPQNVNEFAKIRH